jgi:hypothetical protein
MQSLFALTLFVSAFLLFLVQPMVARMVLPLLGGTPAVWQTCMVFFETALLAGYAYALLAPRRLGARRHALVHLGVLLLPLLVLPLAIPAASAPADSSAPVVWLLSVLLLSVGLPFFALATSGPLLQRWFTETGHAAGRDPYFLYAGSNLGSLLALVAYPLLVEPYLALGEQSRLWSLGYLLLVVLTGCCAVAVWRAAPQEVQPTSEPVRGDTGLGWGRRLRWLLLAFVPSSLMLSVTTYITTDLAAVPLLWLLPLGIYLLTFVLAFARRPWLSPALLARWTPLVVLAVAVALVSEATEPAGVLVGLHLLGLFWVCLFCHSELARDRPPVRHLAEFYLWLAVGGALGGAFNALLAPVLFRSVLEYPLVLVLACLLRPGQEGVADSTRARRLDLFLPLALGLLTVGLVLGCQAFGQSVGLTPGPYSIAAMFALPAILCYTFLERPTRFALGLGALLLASGLYQGVHGRAEVRRRSFFGVHRVTHDPKGLYRLLVHGHTVHGQQSLDPKRAREPLTYYTRKGPIGRLFETLGDDQRLRNVGVVGLGTGAMACYARPGQRWTFFEIDPEVVDLATNSGLFTYWSNCAIEPDLILGDGRLSLARRDDRFGLLVIDAFSSDAIPVHLLTREALDLYRSRLTADGILAFHISNRYVDLEPVLADVGASLEPPMWCLSQYDLDPSPEARDAGRAPSRWVVLGNGPNGIAQAVAAQGMAAPGTASGVVPHAVVSLGVAKFDPSAQPRLKKARFGPVIRDRPPQPPWTDDFHNLLWAIRWGKE